MGVSHIVVKKGGYLFWEGCADSGRVAYRCLKEGYIQRRRRPGWILGESHRCFEGEGVYSERKGKIIGVLHIIVKKG